MARVLSIDPGRARPGISLWEGEELKRTWTPNFQGKNGEVRLKKILDWIEDGCIGDNPDVVIVETNTIAAGKEIGCFMAGMFAGIGCEVNFVHPVQVAKWAEKKFNLKLCNIPRNLKKKRTKELIELLTNRENLSFDECDSILNYYYWKDVRGRSDLRDNHNEPISDHHD